MECSEVGIKNTNISALSTLEALNLNVLDTNERRTPTRKRKWKKILYEDQEYDDNYVHNTFLSSLLTNYDQKYDYSFVCHKIICINHQVIMVLFLLVSYYFIDQKILTNEFVSSINFIIIICKELLIYESHKSLHSSFKNILEVTVTVSILWILSPVLITLTQTHSDNTTYTVAIILLLIHLVLHDYNFIYEKEENINITGATSLGCVVIASVILASRLSSIVQVFSFLSFSSTLFFTFPSIVQCISLKNITYFNYILVPCLFFILCISIRRISTILFYINLIGHLFILLIVPLFFVEKHNLKTKLEGPWDECKIS